MPFPAECTVVPMSKSHPNANDSTESRGDRDPLDLLAEEFMRLRKQGEHVTVEAFAQTHPEHAEQIRAVFPALLIVDEAKPNWSSADSPVDRLTRERLGDYRLVRVVGQGGMGVVYEAEHQALRRRVALKTLPPAVVREPSLIERFRREARAAAGLHHTNIIPVFDVGHEDGIWFYTMQFIEGRGMDQVFDELVALKSSGSDASQFVSQLTSDDSIGSTAASSGAHADKYQKAYFHAIARLGADVADALAYAHERNIVHRDVKPSNLVLDHSGVVWLADFGLAKTDDVDLTRTGDFIGTARYMAPERFGNRGDHRMDIYGLGITLYELCTLQKAFAGMDRMALMDQIVHVEPTPPREVDRFIPLDLETVVLKAMEKDPRRRYTTASELAADLRRIVDDQPIQARRASSLERVTRWMRRNRALTAAILSMAALIVVLVASTLVISQERDQARLNLAEAQRQRRLADASSRRAAEQQRLAEGNFGIAFDAVDRYYNLVSEEMLLNEPGMEPLRAKLIGAAVEFFEQLVENQQDDSSVQLSYIDALHRLGRVEDSFYSKDQAIQYFRQAIDAASREPGAEQDPELLKRMIRAKALLGDCLMVTGQRDEAFEIFTSGIEQATRLVAMQPDEPLSHRLIADIIGRSAAYYSALGELDKALQTALESRDILLVQSTASQPGFDDHKALGLAHRLVGAVKTRTGDYEDAVDDFAQAQREFGQALELDAEDGQIRWLHAGQFVAIGRMLNRIGRDEESLEATRKGIELLEELANEYPLSRRFRRDLAAAYSSLASTLWGQQDFHQALKSYLESYQLHEKLFADSPQDIDTEAKLGRACYNIALTYTSMQESEPVEDYLRQAIDIGRSVCEKAPEQPRFFSDLSRYQSGLASHYLAADRADDARKILAESLSLAEEQYARSPQVIALTLAIQDACSSLGQLLLEAAELDEALEVLNRGISVGEQTLVEAENHQSIIRQLAATNQKLGEVHVRTGNLNAARNAFEASRQYALQDERKHTTQLQLAQLSALQGELVDPETLRAEIPTELLESSARVHLELGLLYAAMLEGSDRSEPPPDVADACLQHFETAESLGAFESQSRTRSLLSHPLLARISLLPAFAEWAASLHGAPIQAEK